MSCKVLTPESILNGALALIGRPPKLINRKGDLYDIMGITLERFRNKLQIHDGNFILKMRRVTLPAGRLDISIDEPAWGRPVMCDLDPSLFPVNQQLPRRDVELIAIQDQELFRNNSMSGSSTASDGGNAISFAQAVSWYRDGGSIRLFFEFGGVFPTTDSTYRFFYEPGGIAEVMENEEVSWLPDFVGLLQLDCALAFLPLTDIPELQYARLERRLSGDIQRREPVMDQWLQMDHTEQSGYAPGYNRSRVGGHQRVR